MWRVILTLFIASSAYAGDLPKNYPHFGFSLNPLYHSSGLQLGQILDVRRDGLVLSSFEGEMMLGLGSDSHRVVDRQCFQTLVPHDLPNQQEHDRLAKKANEECYLFNNPWPFSFLNRAIFHKIGEFGDRLVVLYYANFHVAPSHVLTRTTNEILGAFATDADLKVEPRYSIHAWTALHPESGVIQGRIVRASLEATFIKSYEVIVQESENANNFRAMSVSDGGLFEYITRVMLTGKSVKIEYVRLHEPHAKAMSYLFNYLTDYRITAVELL